MQLKETLAALLADAIAARGQPFAQIAKEIGMTRQRLHQLKTADRTAAPQAITDALTALGYQVRITAETVTVTPAQPPAQAPAQGEKA